MDNKTSVKRNIVLSILAIIIPMFTENIGCAFVFGNILFVIYLKYFKKSIKKIVYLQYYQLLRLC